MGLSPLELPPRAYANVRQASLHALNTSWWRLFLAILTASDGLVMNFIPNSASTSTPSTEVWTFLPRGRQS